MESRKVLFYFSPFCEIVEYLFISLAPFSYHEVGAGLDQPGSRWLTVAARRILSFVLEALTTVALGFLCIPTYLPIFLK